MPRSTVILYATVSGNAEALAQLAWTRLQEAGLAARVHNVADFPADRLRDWDTGLLIVSTWGDGAAPPEAADFCAALARHQDLPLPHLAYAVFALGSSNYKDFCGCGRRLDADLEQCGAVRLLPRVEADTKFKSAFEGWLESVTTVLQAREDRR